MNARVVGATLLLVALLTTGCTAADPGSASPSGSTSTSATATSTASPAPAPTSAPTLSPTGTASDNKRYFDLVNKRLISSTSKPTGRQLVDNLVAAGFDKAQMEVTPDKTFIGLVADAIEFSVKLPGGCLVGQVGAEFGYTGIVAPVLSTGKCLVGTTRTIDW